YIYSRSQAANHDAFLPAAGRQQRNTSPKGGKPITQIFDRTVVTTTPEDVASPYQLPPASRIGHTHLRVADLKRSLAFYRDVLGFTVTFATGTIAMLAAGGPHHHPGMTTSDSLGGARPPCGTTGP